MQNALNTPQPPTRKLGIVLFAHGSRDPLWKLPIEAVAHTIAARQADVPVRCAYLELCAPDLMQAASELIAEGVSEIRVFPLFIGVGRHAREDLPQLIDALKTRYPQAAVELMATAGEHPDLIRLMADIALA